MILEDSVLIYDAVTIKENFKLKKTPPSSHVHFVHSCDDKEELCDYQLLLLRSQRSVRRF